MLATIQPIARVVIIALTTGAALTVVQEIIDGTFKKLVDAIRSEHGLSEEEAKDIFVNILVDLALNSATVGTIVRTKIAVKTAEYLGITSKGFVKRKLTPKAAAAVVQMAGPWEKFKAFSLVSKILTVVGIGTTGIWISSAIANAVEPIWYKPGQINTVLKSLGIKYQIPISQGELQPGPFDSQQFKDYTRAIEATGIKNLIDPTTKQVILYSRQELADIINFVYGQEVLRGNALSAKQMIPLLAKYLMGDSPTVPSPSSTLAKTSSASQEVSQTKVFTGIVSQGTVGSGLIFTPRPDDLIENMGELQEAINNNVAPYLAALLNKVTYEIKVVSSVIVAGIRKSGQSQRIVSSYYQNGSPKYKNVTNKFAVADLFLITDRGTRSKLTSIVLGPTNALSFQPNANDLSQLASGISNNLITSNTDNIDIVVSNTPTASMTPPTAPTSPKIIPTAPAPQTAQKFIGITAQGQRYEGSGSTPQTFFSDKELNGQAFGIELFDLQSSRQGRQSTNMIVSVVPKSAEASPPAQNPTQGNQPPVQETPVSALPATALSAQTLYNFYGALGKQLPSIEERSRLYQSLGLGQAAFYTGTAEQNTRLLQALKLKGV